MKISRKGQITIPRAIRERFGFLPGTDVDLVMRGDAVQIVKSTRGAAVVRAMRGRVNRGISTDVILKLTRE